MAEKEKTHLEELKEALVNPDIYLDYTKDWPIEDLRNAIKEGDESGYSLVSSPEEHIEYFKSNPLE